MEMAQPVVHEGEEAEQLAREFGEENWRNDFDWDENYGEGLMFCILWIRAHRAPIQAMITGSD